MASRIVPIRCPYGATAVMAYLVLGAEPALVDTGDATHARGPIAMALREHGLDLGDVRTVVNTHGHYDHAGGNAAVAAIRPPGSVGNARPAVLIHEAGGALLADAAPHLEGYFTAAARLLAQPAQEATLRAGFATLWGGPSTPTRTLADGDRVDLGGGVVLDVLHLPGHADDHVGLFWEREGVLIAGDAAQGTGSRVGGGPLYFGSVRMARASLARLLAVPFRTLHVSHPFGMLGTDDRATTYGAAGGRAFLAASLDVLDTTEAAVRAALRRRPAEPFPAFARAVTAELERAGRWPLRPDPQTGVPPNAAPTLAGFVAEVDGG